MNKYGEINFRNYKRINVIGTPGAGKSTISKSIKEITGYELFDLDLLLYDNDCHRKGVKETSTAIQSILNRPTFIIDGTYSTSFEQRLKSLDLVVCIDTPAIIAIIRFFKRLLVGRNLKCGERLTWKTLFLMFTFSIYHRIHLQELTEKYKIKFVSIKHFNIYS